jgi:hypothetical protein
VCPIGSNCRPIAASRVALGLTASVTCSRSQMPARSTGQIDGKKERMNENESKLCRNETNF